MNQNEHNAKNVADLAKLQAIKETTERLFHSDKDSTHSLVIVESIKKGSGEAETICRVMADGDIQQILMLVGGLLKSATETRKEELFNLFMQSDEIGSQLMGLCGIGEE
jgi:hypothetical protein